MPIEENENFKELTLKQVKALDKALQKAIPSEEDLERVLLYQLEVKLSNIPKADTYKGLIFNLIKWAQANGNIRRLVIGASLDNPGNGSLTTFIKNNILSLLTLEPITDLSGENLSELTDILQCKDFPIDSMLQAASHNLPEFEVNEELELRENLEDLEISHPLKWLMTLEYYLKTCAGSNDDGIPFIVIFIKNLQEYLTDKRFQESLQTWLMSLPAEVQPEPEDEPQKSIEDRPDDELLRALKISFAVVAEYPRITGDANQYSVKAYVITRLGDGTTLPTKPIKPIELRIPDKSGKTPSAEPSEAINKAEQGQTTDLLCTLEDIETYFPDWLLQVQPIIEQQCTNVVNSYGLEERPTYDLIVELWLPFDELAAPVEAWKIYGKPVRRKKRNLELGQDQQVVIRSYDRLDDIDALNKLRMVWSKPVADATSSKTVSRSQHLDCWTKFSKLQASKQAMQMELLALSLSCQVCANQQQSQREDLFAWMLQNGISTGLWSRYDSLTEKQKESLKKRMEALLAEDISTCVDQLLINVKNARTLNQAVPLALWCDDPNRIDELRQYRERGRL